MVFPEVKKEGLGALYFINLVIMYVCAVIARRNILKGFLS